MCQKIKDKGGFTIVETVVSMVILSLGVIPLLGLFNSSAGNYHRAASTTAALHIAEEKIEALGERDLSTALGTSEWTVHSEMTEYEFCTEVIDVSYLCGSGDGSWVPFYRIKVSVRWDHRGNLQEIFLTNYSAGKKTSS